jgi:hypothetical protein
MQVGKLEKTYFFLVSSIAKHAHHGHIEGEERRNQMAETQKIEVRYSSIDGCSIRRTYRTLAGAQAFAQKYVGAHPELGSHYAVSGDGVGKITCAGATLLELFPALAPPPARSRFSCTCSENTLYWAGCSCAASEEGYQEAMEAAEAEAAGGVSLFGSMRGAGCTCSDDQLRLVGCDCAAERARSAAQPEIVCDDIPF